MKHSNSTKDARVLTSRFIEIPALRMLFNVFKPFPKSRRRIPNCHGKIYVSSSQRWTPFATNNFEIKFSVEPASRKGIIIGIVLSFLSQSCGSYIFIVYASTIFAKSGTNFSPEWSSVVLALVQIFGTLIAARFVETQGRKPLLIISLAGCTFGNSAMAAYLYCDKLGYDVSMFTWVPVTSLGFVILISSVGIVPLPRICLVEALPAKVRSFGLTVGMISLSVFLFVTLALYPILLEIIDLHGCMLAFAATCVFGVVFVIVYVDETKGKTIDLLNEEKVTTKRETA